MLPPPCFTAWMKLARWSASHGFVTLYNLVFSWPSGLLACFTVECFPSAHVSIKATETVVILVDSCPRVRTESLLNSTRYRQVLGHAGPLNCIWVLRMMKASKFSFYYLYIISPILILPFPSHKLTLPYDTKQGRVVHACASPEIHESNLYIVWNCCSSITHLEEYVICPHLHTCSHSCPGLPRVPWENMPSETNFGSLTTGHRSL